ncbi:hypothetical protein N7481_001655 [Penicillium waksmanii]|uniref:uncharacterized protein n=1 Tax=Penicillium waksmanii TaxID=69791 RepID=UPI002546DD8C|nr:uncharacterized protein N7481_001655 [Penicillium waksmanii]KAJ5994678.1 hypothetical protein N7481_001655 [Penicillium waksmanii]
MPNISICSVPHVVDFCGALPVSDEENPFDTVLTCKGKVLVGSFERNGHPVVTLPGLLVLPSLSVTGLGHSWSTPTGWLRIVSGSVRLSLMTLGIRQFGSEVIGPANKMIITPARERADQPDTLTSIRAFPG